MSARAETRKRRPAAAVPRDGVAVVVPPRPEGEDGPIPLLRQGARLAQATGVGFAPLSWLADDEPDIEALAASVTQAVAAGRPLVLLFADDDLGRQLAPMVAFDLGTSAVLGCTDVIAREGANVYVKPVHGGWLQREVSFAPGHLQVATLAPAIVPAAAEADQAEPVLLSFAQGAAGQAGRPPSTTRLELVPPDFRTVDIVHARRIVGAGMGTVGDDLLGAVVELAELLEGSVGATRPVVDEGRLSKERLIGQTGKTVTPDLYLALGISGSPHHVAGVQGAGRIVAVDRDDHAPMLSFSDEGYIADLEMLLPALVDRIRTWRDTAGEPDDAEA